MAPAPLRREPLSLWSDVTDRDEATFEPTSREAPTYVSREREAGSPEDSESDQQTAMPARRRRRRGKGRRREVTVAAPTIRADDQPMTVVELFGLTLPTSSGKLATGSSAAPTASSTASSFGKLAELAPQCVENLTSGMWYESQYDASWDHPCSGDASGGAWAYPQPMYYPSPWPCAAPAPHAESPLSYPAPCEAASASLGRAAGVEVDENAVNTWLCARFAGALPPSTRAHEELLRNARPEKYED